MRTLSSQTFWQRLTLFLCRILEDLDQRVEGTYDKLKRGSKRLQRFILANEGEQVFCHVLSDLCQSPNPITASSHSS